MSSDAESGRAAVERTASALRFIRSLGVPFLRGADDATLRGFAVGLRTTALRRRASPASHAATAPAVSFRGLSLDDRIDLLADNAAAFEHKCALVDGAERSIDVALYYLADDASGRRFGDALARAAARGVRVRLAADALAMQEKQLIEPRGAGSGALDLADRLRRAGIAVTICGDASSCMHRKFLLVDDRSLVLGGRNVADHYTQPGWRDLELAVEGPLAAAFRSVVDETFVPSTSPTAAPAGVVPGAPGGGGSAFAAVAAELLRTARETVDIEHAYILSLDWLESAVAGAVARGVRVRVFTNSVETNDLPIMGWRATTALLSLLARGARVFVREPPASTLHTKLVIADARRFVLGSSNLDYYTPAFCSELDVALEGEALGRDLVAHVERGLAEPTTREVVKGSPLHEALARRVEGVGVSRLFDFFFRDCQ